MMQPLSSRRMRIALVASLVFNLVLAAGFLWRLRPPPGPPSPAHMLDRMAASLPDADAALLRAALEQRRLDFQAVEQGMRQGFAGLRDAIGRTPFDPDAFRQAAAALRQNHQRHSDVMDQTMLDTLPRLSPEGRRRLAEDGPR